MAKYPREGTLSHQIWKACDNAPQSLELGEFMPLKDHVISMFPDANKSTLSTQISRWKKYSGIEIKPDYKPQMRGVKCKLPESGLDTVVIVPKGGFHAIYTYWSNNNTFRLTSSQFYDSREAQAAALREHERNPIPNHVYSTDADLNSHCFR